MTKEQNREEKERGERSGYFSRDSCNNGGNSNKKSNQGVIVGFMSGQREEKRRKAGERNGYFGRDSSDSGRHGSISSGKGNTGLSIGQRR